MSNNNLHVDIAIIGGGISGLSTAWYVQKGDPALSYVLLERGERWGGKVRTDTVDGFGDAPFVVEGGPDSFITQKPWAMGLARELGLGEDLLPTNDDQRKTYVLNRGRPTPLPDGVLMIIPTQFMPFALSPLISPLGKLRMGLDLLIPAKRDGQDETLAEFVQRRLGNEALDKIAEPLMSGIYNAEAEKQSLLATFPRFRAIEEKHGSLIKGMLASKKAADEARAKAPAANGSKPLSVFMSLKDGMNTLVDALTARLTGDLRLRVGVDAIHPSQEGYRLDLSDGSSIVARRVILATPAYFSADLLADLAPQAATLLDGIRYVGTGTISLAFRRQDVPDNYPGFGIVVPRSEARDVNAITWSSTKFNRRAPQDHVLARVFFGGSRSPHMMDLDDDEALRRVRAELKVMVGVGAEPLFHRIYRWPRSNPQYDVGHLDRVAAIEAALPPGIHVTGSAYRGIGLPDCVHQAQQTAEAVVNGDW
ncbi:MAG: protoporphyrinogen oxidase [Caldilineaceae bacterium]|nr:protoporphyrinogen oxidase [Caldilineaceae bacterium]